MSASPTMLEFNGEKYSVNVSIFAPTRDTKFTDLAHENKETMIFENIDSIEIVHDIINPLLTGKIVYTDSEYVVMKKFQSLPYVYVHISFGKHNQKASDDIITLERQFNHTFLVDNIQIVGQSGPNVTYQIDLISHHWWNFTKSLSYNTSGVEKSVTSILADCFNSSDLTFNTNNWSTEASRIFFSSANESLMSAYSYLMSKTYIPTDRIGGAFFTIYDHLNNVYNLWSLKNAEPKSYLTKDDFLDSIFIPIEKGVASELIQSKPPKVSMVNYQPRTQMIKSLFDYSSWSYDYTSNKFTPTVVETPSIINDLMEGWKDYTSRYYDFKATDSNAISSKIVSTQFKHEESIWSNIIDQYKNLIGLMINNNVLVINSDGELRRKPGDAVKIEVDNSDQNSLQDLEGLWINLRTRHIITPSEYKTNMIVGRIHQ